VRTAIERKRLALLRLSRINVPWPGDVVGAGVTIFNPGFFPTVDRRSQAPLFIYKLS